MGNSKTYFEQVPVEIAKKAAEREKSAGDLDKARDQAETPEHVEEDNPVRTVKRRKAK